MPKEEATSQKLPNTKSLPRVDQKRQRLGSPGMGCLCLTNPKQLQEKPFPYQESHSIITLITYPPEQLDHVVTEQIERYKIIIRIFTAISLQGIASAASAGILSYNYDINAKINGGYGTITVWDRCQTHSDHFNGSPYQTLKAQVDLYGLDQPPGFIIPEAPLVAFNCEFFDN